MNPARQTSSTPNSSSRVLMVPSNSARLPYSLWSTTCEAQTNTLNNMQNKTRGESRILHIYPCLDASQRCPLQALNARPVGDDHHNLRRAGRTFGPVYQCLQIGACDDHKKNRIKITWAKNVHEFNALNRMLTCSRYQHTNFGPLVWFWSSCAVLVHRHSFTGARFCFQEAVL